MKRMPFLGLVFVCLLGLMGMAGLATPAAADVGTVDDVPAATLLLPYFEVDLDNPQGVTTLFSINNASATAVLAHVVLWSDLSVPVLDFNVYLTGYDVQTVNLRDILMSGLMPRTASDGQDPQDTISPQGRLSQDVNFASCAGQLPLPNLPATFIAHLQNALTGQSSTVLGNRCAGQNKGDRIARGYVTVDTVNNCTLRFPGDAGYFAAGGTGDVTNQNVLWGDYFYVVPGEDSAQGETLVHIEADATNPETSVAGQYTFYGRYVSWTASDNREPLATTFAARFVEGGAFGGGTDLAVWRDSKVNQGAFTCPATSGTRPTWYPLGLEALVILDEEENVAVERLLPISPQPPLPGLAPFPAEAQRVRIAKETFFPTEPTLPLPFQFGWLFLSLNTTISPPGNNPPEDPQAAQAWVTAVMAADRDPAAPAGSPRVRGRFAVGFDAIQLDNATHASHQVIAVDE